MAFPNRALVTAPVARDLSAEHPNTVRVPGATNGTLQAWDTLDEDYWLTDGTVTVYPTLATVPLALRRYVVQVLRYDDALASTNPAWRRLIDCTVADFVKTSNGIKAATTLVAGDRPLEWDLLHRWAGNPAETLGAP